MIHLGQGLILDAQASAWRHTPRSADRAPATQATVKETDINPYSPSTVEIPEIADGPVRRPYAVWLIQALLALVLVMFFVGMFRNFNVLSMGQMSGRALGGLVFGLAFAALFLAVMVGIHRGLRVARWFGAALILAFIAYCILGADTSYYASDAERSGGLVGRRVLMPLLCAWWLYAYAFSPKAKRYFSRNWSGRRTGEQDAA